MSLLAFIEVMVVILLAVVGGLLIWLHLRLSKLSDMVAHEEKLAEKLAQHLREARDGLSAFADLTRGEGTDLEAKLKQGRDVTQDLDFMMHRAEKILAQIDTLQESRPQVTAQQPAPASVSVTEPAVVSQQREAAPVVAPAPPMAERQNEQQAMRAVLFGSEAEDAPLVAPEPQHQQRRSMDVRQTFLKAIETRNQTLHKTAPKAYGSQAYQQTAARDDKSDLRAVLEGR